MPGDSGGEHSNVWRVGCVTTGGGRGGRAEVGLSQLEG